MLQSIYKSGLAINLIIAVLIVEIAWFALVRRWPVAIGLIPGLFLMLALRSAVVGEEWYMVALWVTLSLPAHLADLRLRTRQ